MRLNDIILQHFKLRKILENYKELHSPFIKTPHSSFTSCAHDPQSRVTWCKFGVNYTRKWPNLAPCYISPISFSLERFPFLALSSTLLTFGRYQGRRFAKKCCSICVCLCPRDEAPMTDLGREWRRHYVALRHSPARGPRHLDVRTLVLLTSVSSPFDRLSPLSSYFVTFISNKYLVRR